MGDEEMLISLFALSSKLLSCTGNMKCETTSLTSKGNKTSQKCILSGRTL